MTTEPIGRRVASYRKAAGFRTAEDLAEAIGNPAITKATIQNVESGRKTDLSVSQLLDISKALGVPPVALVVPINKPSDKAAIPGVGEAVSSMTNWELVRWFTDRDTVSGPALRVWIRAVMSNIENLTNAIERYPALLTASQAKSEIIEHKYSDGETDHFFYVDPSEEAADALNQLAANARTAYDRLSSMTKDIDLSWAEGPWLTYGVAKHLRHGEEADG